MPCFSAGAPQQKKEKNMDKVDAKVALTYLAGQNDEFECVNTASSYAELLADLSLCIDMIHNEEWTAEQALRELRDGFEHSRLSRYIFDLSVITKKEEGIRDAKLYLKGLAEA